MEINNKWKRHYRGYKLHVDDNQRTWWVPYIGEERLFALNMPKTLLENIRKVKPIGGSIRVTEVGDVVGKVEENDSWTPKWIGKLTKPLIFSTNDDSKIKLKMRPTNINAGDIWPSIYDGAKYSFLGRDRIWWTNPEGYRQYANEQFPVKILKELLYYKTTGGSVRITPWGDILTLVPTHPAPPKELIKQFDELNPIVRNIIAIKKERGLKMLQVYIGEIDFEITLKPPRKLTEPLTPEKRKEMHDFLISFQPSGFVGMAPKGTKDKIEIENGIEPDDPEDWESNE